MGENIVEELLFAYKDDDADLLCSRYDVFDPREWYWAHTVTGEFTKRYGRPGSLPWTSAPEHVQRLSRRLMSELENAAEIGACAWSEMFVPVACKNSRFQLSCKTFRAEHVGEPFSWDGKVDRRSWEERENGGTNAIQYGRLYHALKF